MAAILIVVTLKVDDYNTADKRRHLPVLDIQVFFELPKSSFVP